MLDLEVGHGAVTGWQKPHGEPGAESVDPQVMLQWSDDAGQTWSHEYWVSAGRLGYYKWRAIWRRLGRARQRTWRVVMMDAIPWHLLNASVSVEKGTS